MSSDHTFDVVPSETPNLLSPLSCLSSVPFSVELLKTALVIFVFELFHSA